MPASGSLPNHRNSVDDCATGPAVCAGCWAQRPQAPGQCKARFAYHWHILLCRMPPCAVSMLQPCCHSGNKKPHQSQPHKARPAGMCVLNSGRKGCAAHMPNMTLSMNMSSCTPPDAAVQNFSAAYLSSNVLQRTERAACAHPTKAHAVADAMHPARTMSAAATMVWCGRCTPAL